MNELVLQTLTERFEAALGEDPWALGHRSAALAFAARLIDEDEVDDLLARGFTEHHREVALLLKKYLDDPRQVRGFPTS